MPLRAYIEDKEIVSIDLNDEEWSALKARLKAKKTVLILPCCGQEGFLRTSSKGLKHFVHLKSANPCDWKPESAEHLKAKVAIMEACREQGWNAIPEFSEADWRADVLAVQGGKRIAFEVQWSRQTYEETRLRQERYKASNVRGCWFFRIAPKEMSDYDKTLVADKETPAFKIFKDENSNKVFLKRCRIMIRKKVQAFQVLPDFVCHARCIRRLRLHSGKNICRSIPMCRFTHLPVTIRRRMGFP